MSIDVDSRGSEPELLLEMQRSGSVHLVSELRGFRVLEGVHILLLLFMMGILQDGYCIFEFEYLQAKQEKALNKHVE